MHHTALPARISFRGKRALGLGALPDFLIVGGMKCASTALYFDLIQHPRIRGARKKEVHFFDTRFDRGLDWYRASFPVGGPQRRWLTGEASPYYLFHPLVPGRIRENLPATRLIAVLRNPVERAFSHYQHGQRSGWDDLSFEEALEQEEQRLDGECERIAAEPGRKSHAFRFQSYKTRGLYADQIERWWQHFPREQLLIVSTEQYRDHPQRVMNRVLEHLGLEAWQGFDFRAANVGGYREQMDPRTRARLSTYFAPHNRRLYDLVGQDFGWF